MHKPIIDYLEKKLRDPGWRFAYLIIGVAPQRL
jgi:hypothetical protein